MPFHDVRMDTLIAAGSTGGPSHNTTTNTLASGKEQRNINWSGARHRYNIGTAIRTNSAMATIRSFFNARRGSGYAFRFKDWLDYELARQNIGTTNGSLATFQIFKRYTDGAYAWDRKLTKPVSGTVRCWQNGVERTIGAGASQFQVNLLTGIVTLGATLAATTGQVVEVQCEFDVPVRFDMDDMPVEIRDADILEWPDVPLIEVDE